MVSSMVMTRSFAEFMERNWPPEVARVVNGEAITWEELGRQRGERQRRRLETKREVEPRRIVPAYVWTFEVPGEVFGGWWAYLVTRDNGYEEPTGVFDTGPKGNIKWGPLARTIMEACPLGLLAIETNWKDWMEALAEHWPRRHPHDPRPAGSLVGWYDRHEHRFALSKTELTGEGGLARRHEGTK
jgi:hypothetical protein